MSQELSQDGLIQRLIKICTCGYEMIENRDCIAGQTHFYCYHCRAVRSYKEQLDMAITKARTLQQDKETQ